ncbi:glycosyltransferase family 25 protein [Phlyctema vagabunda]|uniref:Glycosyltransferase family 25 protein n=1 Tax=Phlyctema vagabunda TaxID=108571 RepID=A0ABR4PPT3_9HELO
MLFGLTRQANLALTALLLFVLIFIFSTDNTAAVQERYASTGTGSLSDTQNATLGFQRIFVLSLPERTDKRDGIALGASLSGFQVEFVDGVRGEQMSPKAIPQNWEATQSPATLGCWRGHMTIALKMVTEDIKSVLIFEDDADWDVMFKSQLYEFAKGSQILQERQRPHISPYGDDWDILWLGHCGITSRTTEDQLYYTIPDDPTMEPIDQVYGSQPDRTAPVLRSNKNRLVFRGVSGRCLTAYALSLRGAQRLIAKQMSSATTIDRAVSGLCSQKREDFNCIAPWPTFVGTFKDAGDVSRDSDRVDVRGETRKIATTRDITYPVRLNIDRLLGGNLPFRAQWTEEAGTLPELQRDIKIPLGHAEWVTKDQYEVQST